VPRDVVAILETLPPGAMPPAHWAVDFWIGDAAAAVDRALELGGSAVAPLEKSAFFLTAVLRDPQGATFSISQLTVPN
jgi:predicted enzyme related to lactoylglutathione lyase